MKIKEIISEQSDGAVSPVGSVVPKKNKKLDAKKKVEEIAKQLKTAK